MIDCKVIKTPARGVPRIIAVFSFRYDAHLVPDLIRNISPFVHGYAAFDDRATSLPMTDEPARRNALHAAARQMGADWILAVDPDERFERAIADRIGNMTADPELNLIWTFNLRELFTPLAYRTDGIWNEKKQMRLYPAKATIEPLQRGLHGRWIANSANYIEMASGLNLYHLRHVSVRRTRHRRDFYASADPKRLFHSIGYDYLADTRGMVLKEISTGRRYDPDFIEDHGLWAAPPSQFSGEPAIDPLSSQLETLLRAIRHNAAENAACLARDITMAVPDHDCLRLVAAHLARKAGHPQDALDLLAPFFLGNQKPPQLAQEIRSACIGVSDGNPPPHPAFDQPDALWRRWVNAATFHEGPNIGRGRLCTIVVGHKSPKTLLPVVAALRSQSEDTEIVVVNSAGGDPATLLADHLAHIRLIDIQESVYVGLARNVGIDASHAEFVSFLADDCVPGPGWVASRLARHGQGAEMVSTAVMPARPRSIVGILEQTFVFPGRAPDLNEDEALHYGRSYTRDILRKTGYFAPALPVGEDSEYNRRADFIGSVEWAPEIYVTHMGKQSLRDFYRDLFKRGQRAAYFMRRPGTTKEGPHWVQRRLAVQHYRSRVVLTNHADLNPITRFALRLALRYAIHVQEKAYLSMEAPLSAAEEEIQKATEPDALIDALNAAIALTPQNWRLFMKLGSAHLSKDAKAGFPAAMEAFRKANALAPAESEPVRLACTAISANQGHAASVIFAKEALAMAPSQASLACQVAAFSQYAKQFDSSIYYGQRSLLHDPTDVRTYLILQKTYLLAGNPAQSEHCKATRDQFLAVKEEQARRPAA